MNLSVVEVQTVQAGSRQPLMSPCGQVHREVDVSPQCSKPSSMESLHGKDVASNGADGQVLVTTGASLLDDPLRRGQVAVESCSWVVSADRRVPIDASVVLRQLGPQGSTNAVVALGVITNDEFQRGRRGSR